MIYQLDWAVEKFLTKKEAMLPPHLINPFLRIMETMEKPCEVSLKYDQAAAPNNPKAFYTITERKTDERNCETCGNRMPLSTFSGKNHTTLCSRAKCNKDNGFMLWEPSCGEKIVTPN